MARSFKSFTKSKAITNGYGYGHFWKSQSARGLDSPAKGQLQMAKGPELKIVHENRKLSQMAMAVSYGYGHFWKSQSARGGQLGKLPKANGPKIQIVHESKGQGRINFNRSRFPSYRIAIVQQVQSFFRTRQPGQRPKANS